MLRTSRVKIFHIPQKEPSILKNCALAIGRVFGFLANRLLIRIGIHIVRKGPRTLWVRDPRTLDTNWVRGHGPKGPKWAWTHWPKMSLDPLGSRPFEIGWNDFELVEIWTSIFEIWHRNFGRIEFTSQSFNLLKSRLFALFLQVNLIVKICILNFAAWKHSV